MKISNVAGWAGLFSVVWFWSALFAFGALRPDYSQTRRAVSELGALGAPNALAWNLFGFGMTGLLLAIVAYAAIRTAYPRSRIAAWLVMAAALAFAATAAPADMDDFGALTSQIHIGASLASGVLWFVGVTFILRRDATGGRMFGWISLFFLLAFAVTIVVRGADILAPGLAQRLSFSVYFAWHAAASVYLLRIGSARASAEARHDRV